MKPYQVHLFEGGGKIPVAAQAEPVFVYGDKRYLNFLNFDCFNLRNSDYLKEATRLHIEARGIDSVEGRGELMNKLQEMMANIKDIESLLVFPDEIAALFALFSICGPQTNFFCDYDTSLSVISVLQHRNIEYYSHRDLEQLNNILNMKTGKVIVIDGLYEWIGNIGPVNELITIARDNECIVVANEINSFGLLGRDGRGFIDLFNAYGDVVFEIGSFNKYFGGFGCYLAAKKYLTRKIEENIADLIEPMPQCMLATNIAGLEGVIQGKIDKNKNEKLWKNSRYFSSRLRQDGFKTISDTPIAVIAFSNNEEADEFRKRLFNEQIIVAQNKERIRLCISIEHSKEDLDFCLDRFEAIGKELGILT